MALDNSISAMLYSLNKQADIVLMRASFLNPDIPSGVLGISPVFSHFKSIEKRWCL